MDLAGAPTEFSQVHVVGCPKITMVSHPTLTRVISLHFSSSDDAGFAFDLPMLKSASFVTFRAIHADLSLPALEEVKSIKGLVKRLSVPKLCRVNDVAASQLFICFSPNCNLDVGTCNFLPPTGSDCNIRAGTVSSNSSEFTALEDCKREEDAA